MNVKNTAIHSTFVLRPQSPGYSYMPASALTSNTPVLTSNTFGAAFSPTQPISLQPYKNNPISYVPTQPSSAIANALRGMFV
jgi:hypothetical protein